MVSKHVKTRFSNLSANRPSLLKLTNQFIKSFFCFRNKPYLIIHFFEKWHALNSSREMVCQSSICFMPFSMLLSTWGGSVLDCGSNGTFSTFKISLIVFNCSALSGYIKIGSIQTKIQHSQQLYHPSYKLSYS